MRVALIAPFGLRPKGTTSARVLPIARVLAQQGADVRVIVPPWDDPRRAGQRWRQDGYEVVHTRLGDGPATPAIILIDALGHIRGWRPDVVHAFKPIGYSGALAWLLARNLSSARPSRKPLIVVDADDFEGPRGWAGRRNQRIGGAIRGVQERSTLRRAHRVTVASRWLEEYVHRLGVGEETIHYLPNGHGLTMDTPVDQPTPRSARHLLWYTRFTEASSERVASLVAPILMPDETARLVVVGEEIGRGDRAAATSAFAAAGIGHQVEWAGYEPDSLGAGAFEGASTVAIYPLDDDLVNRARCPSKIPQLMAMGIPIVSERVGEAAAYLKSAADECLVAPGDAETFRARVMRLLTDDEARLSVSSRLRKAADQWSWEATAGGLHDWYRTAINEYSTAGAL